MSPPLQDLLRNNIEWAARVSRDSSRRRVRAKASRSSGNRKLPMNMDFPCERSSRRGPLGPKVSVLT